MAKGNSSREQIHQAAVAEQDSQGLMRMEAFSGILPHPEYLQKYEALCPGMADRIMRMAENEAAHRHELENAASKRDDSVVEVFANESKSAIREKYRGQWLGFLLGIGCVAGALWTASTPLAIALCTTSIGFVLSAFLGKRKAAVTPQSADKSE